MERLKQESGKPIIAHGGAGFARSLIAAGVVDEFYLGVFPVALGCGLSRLTQMRSQVDVLRVPHRW